MQPLNWDTTARGALPDTLNLFTGADAMRPAGLESFGDHLYRSDTAPSPAPAQQHHGTTTETTPPPQPHEPTAATPPAPAPRRYDYRTAKNPSQSETDHDPGATSEVDHPETGDKSSPESTAEHEEPRDTAANTDQENKPMAGQRGKSTTRRIATQIEGELQRAQDVAELVSSSKSKRSAAGGAKVKGTTKDKSDNRSQHATGPTAADAVANKIGINAVTPTTAAEEQVAELGSSNGADDALGKRKDHTDLGTARSQQAEELLIAAASTDGALPPNNDGEHAGPLNKRSTRVQKDQPGIEETLSLEQSANAAANAEGAVVAMEGQATTGASSTAGRKGDANAIVGATNANVAGASGPASSLRFAQHLAAKPGARAAKTAPLTDMEHARLIDRVARAFQTAEARGGTVTLRLHPPELGALRVELRLVDGALSAKLEAESPAARSVLLDNVQILQDRLAEQGVRVERFDVDLMDRRSAGDFAGFEQRNTQEQEQRHAPNHEPNAPESREPETVRPQVRPATAGNLNVII